MRKLALKLLAGIFAAQIIVGACAAQDQPAPRFTLQTISESGGALIVRETNMSNEEIRNTCVKEYCDFNISVVFGGLSMQKKKDVQAHEKRGDFNPCINGRMPLRLKPGAHADSIAVPSRFYDMSNPGEYVVTVSKETNPHDPANSVTVTSNPFTIVVTRGEAQTAQALQAKENALGPLMLAVDESNIDDGRPIVDITRKNMTDKTLFLHDAYDAIRWYDFDVRLGSQPVPETKLLRLAKAPGAVFIEVPLSGNISLEPGETTETTLNLSDYYDMSVSGEYHVTASLVCAQCYPDQLVKSNTIIITVLPAGSTPAADDSTAPQ